MFFLLIFKIKKQSHYHHTIVLFDLVVIDLHLKQSATGQGQSFQPFFREKITNIYPDKVSKL